MNTKPYINELESLERESTNEVPGSGRDEESEKRFSGEFGAFLSSKSESEEVMEVPKGSSGTIFFGSIEDRVNTFNSVDANPSMTEVVEASKVEILNPIASVVSEKTVKHTVDASKLVGKSIFELFKDYIFSSSKEKKKDPKKVEEEAKKNRNNQSFLESLKGMAKSKNYESKLRDSAEQISRKLGGNLSYEGSLTETLEVRVDIETLLNKKNSELSENELRAKRARAVQTASGGKKGHRPVAKQEMNPEKGINAGQRNAYTQAG